MPDWRGRSARSGDRNRKMRHEARFRAQWPGKVEGWDYQQDHRQREISADDRQVPVRFFRMVEVHCLDHGEGIGLAMIGLNFVMTCLGS